MSVPTFSIITVCFNAKTTLPDTFASLMSQTCKDYEWVVVDGASTDGTVEWIRAQGKATTFVSEKDKGIYDAMCKGVRLARGEFVYFLNADDRLSDPEALAAVVAEIRGSPEVDLIYGNVLYTDGQKTWQKRFEWLTRDRLVYGDLCHQGVFARRRLFDQVGTFDISLKYNADFDWLLRVFNSGAVLKYVRRNVAIFFFGGAHVKNWDATVAERNAVMARYCSRWPWLVGHWILRAELKIRQWLHPDERMA